MIYLHGKGTPFRVSAPIIGCITRSPVSYLARRPDQIVYGSATDLEAFQGDWSGYAGLVTPSLLAEPLPLPAICRVPHLDYLGEGDVVSISPTGTVSVLYRRSSRDNSILLTEQCNSRCVMCSQPPKELPDAWRIAEALRLIELIDPGCRELGLTGGEPTLLGDDLLRLVAKCRDFLPRTSLHMLTNGRRFSDVNYARRLGALGHPDLMLGIPVYSDTSERHDFVVQARGAFDETVRGLYNLAKAAVPVEIRVVLHRHTVERLVELAEYIGRTFPFAAHVALMGLEPFGYASGNFDFLWIDPVDYGATLEEAVIALALRGMPVSVYNVQLCVLPQSLWPFARRSISDWKNVYLRQCESCDARPYCCGFFHSATKRYSHGIAPIPLADPSIAVALRAWCGKSPELGSETVNA